MNAKKIMSYSPLLSPRISWSIEPSLILSSLQHHYEPCQSTRTDFHQLKKKNSGTYSNTRGCQIRNLIHKAIFSTARSKLAICHLSFRLSTQILLILTEWVLQRVFPKACQTSQPKKIRIGNGFLRGTYPPMTPGVDGVLFDCPVAIHGFKIQVGPTRIHEMLMHQL